MWPGLVQLAKDGGADVIETYVFWNGHEPFPGKVRLQLNIEIQSLLHFSFSFLNV